MFGVYLGKEISGKEKKINFATVFCMLVKVRTFHSTTPEGDGRVWRRQWAWEALQNWPIPRYLVGNLNSHGSVVENGDGIDAAQRVSRLGRRVKTGNANLGLTDVPDGADRKDNNATQPQKPTKTPGGKR